jgi:hypothetical protein
MWPVRSVMNPHHTRRNTLKSSEDFRVHILGDHTPISQPIAHALHE